MQVSEFAEIILATFDGGSEMPAAIYENLLEGFAMDTCMAVNVTLAARYLFAVPLKEGGIIVIDEQALDDPDLKDALKSIIVEDGLKTVNKEHLF